MFTGIVQKAFIAWVEASSSLSRYAILLPPPLLKGLAVGASVSVNGVCQTVVQIDSREVVFEAIASTLACTNLGNLAAGQAVNVERSLKMGDEIGGHLLSGHVFGTAQIERIQHPHPQQHNLTLTVNPAWLKYLLPKGFVALNGVSLTLNQVEPSGHVTVNLIPETLNRTTFETAQEGDLINVEIDPQTQAIIDTVERVSSEKVMPV